MPPKKSTTTKKAPSKKVNFTPDQNSNVFVNAPLKENYPDTANLNLDETELEKETEVETEIEKEEEEDLEDEDEDDKDEDEDHEIDDELDLDLEDENVEDLDELYEGSKKKVTKNKKKKIKEDADDDIKSEDNEECEYNYDEIYDEKKEEPSVIVLPEERITLPKLTKYERVRLIGTRAKQISLGAKVMVKNTAGLNPIEIAKLELEHRMIPMKVKRVLPDNKIEIWKLSELELDN